MINNDIPSLKPAPVEEWRTIADYPDYAVSNRGRVKRLTDVPGTRARAGNILKPTLNSNGYPHVGLSKNGKRRTCRVHRLASSRFKGVSWHAKNKKWIACIDLDGRKKHLGSFMSEIDAARAYDAVAYTAWHEFAYLNFPDEVEAFREAMSPIGGALDRITP